MIAQLKSPRAKEVVRNLPGEMVHRAASTIIIVEATLQSLHSLKLVVAGGIIFIVVEVISMAYVEIRVRETDGGGR